jgi:isopropylmalate/homocitrate/citramalate synthase
VRIATHCTEADISSQHIQHARKLGLDVAGFLMMAHMSPPVELARQAKLMESYGVHGVYLVDSAGALLMHEVADRFKAFWRRSQARDGQGDACSTVLPSSLSGSGRSTTGRIWPRCCCGA